MSILIALMFYVAAVVFIGGLVAKLLEFARTPAPLLIPTTPAPQTGIGVAIRMSREILWFESLFKGNLWIWALAMAFHFGLLLVVIRHLRYFLEPVPHVIAMLQPFGIYGGLVMAAGLAGLWGRRWFVERIRYISTPSDHLMLALLLVIAVSGLAMKFGAHTDVVSVKAFFLGLLRFDFSTSLPSDPLLALHLICVALLMLIFPFSKLLHAPGVFFSPTRNQVDNPRQVRHLPRWAAGWEGK